MGLFSEFVTASFCIHSCQHKSHKQKNTYKTSSLGSKVKDNGKLRSYTRNLSCFTMVNSDQYCLCTSHDIIFVFSSFSHEKYKFGTDINHIYKPGKRSGYMDESSSLIYRQTWPGKLRATTE